MAKPFLVSTTVESQLTTTLVANIVSSQHERPKSVFNLENETEEELSVRDRKKLAAPYPKLVRILSSPILHPRGGANLKPTPPEPQTRHQDGHVMRGRWEWFPNCMVLKKLNEMKFHDDEFPPL